MNTHSDEFRLLGGNFSPEPTPLRPPWALPEATFIKLCDHCDDCIDACRQGILVGGRGGYPQVDFSAGGCLFCGDCVTACTRGGLTRDREKPWDLKAYIARTCLTQHNEPCDLCTDHCPVGAIHLRQQVAGPAVPLLDTGLCNGCGGCVSVCPASAIGMYASMQGGGMLS